MNVWCLVPAHNRRDLTVRVVHQLAGQTQRPRIVVVDCGSTDGTADAVSRAADDVRVLHAGADAFWGQAITLGLAAIASALSDRDYVLLLNDDVLIDRDYVSALVACSRAHGDAAVGSLVFDENDRYRLVELGTRIDWLRCWVRDVIGDEEQRTRALTDEGSVTAVDALSGRGALYPVGALRRAGLRCHPLLPHYWADLELSARVHAHGCPLVVSHQARVWTPARASGVGGEAPALTRLFARRSRFNVVDAVVFFSSTGPMILRPSAAARVVLPRVRAALRGAFRERMR